MEKTYVNSIKICNMTNITFTLKSVLISAIEGYMKGKKVHLCYIHNTDNVNACFEYSKMMLNLSCSSQTK